MPSTSPPRGTIAIQAVVFDTFGTVCDFYTAFRQGFQDFINARGLEHDAGALAIEWRTAYLIATATQAFTDGAFRPLMEINRDNLLQLLDRETGVTPTPGEVDSLTSLWRAMEPWPDVIEGLERIRSSALVGPLSNGNLVDMALLARHAGLPWDVILGSSLAGNYKPHPSTYLGSVQALGLEPGEVCMVAAHQVDLAFAAGHGMQTAFVPRPLEFGGPVKPRDADPTERYLDAAEVHVEGNWTYIAEDFIDLARQLADG